MRGRENKCCGATRRFCSRALRFPHDFAKRGGELPSPHARRGQKDRRPAKFIENLLNSMVGSKGSSNTKDGRVDFLSRLAYDCHVGDHPALAPSVVRRAGQ
jgi:hypothetical protein